MALDFSKMKYPIDSKNYKDIESLHKIFSEFKYKSEAMSTEQIVKYIVFCYHRYSPFVMNTESLIDRKREILDYIEVKKTKHGYYTDDVQKIIKNQDNDVSRAACLFLRYENNIKYYSFVQTLEAFYSLNDQLAIGASSAKEGKDVADIAIKLEKVEDRLEKLKRELAEGDTALCDHIGSLEKDIEKGIKLFPEDYAR
jgi:predicted ATPase